MTPASYRRHPHLVLYWRAQVPIGRRWDSAARITLTPEVAALLSALDEWTTADALCAAQPDLGSAADVERLLAAMADRGVLQRSADAAGEGTWAAWAPDAPFFHFGTRDPQFRHTPASYDEVLRRKAATNPPPPPAKSIAGARHLLPRAGGSPALTRTLRERRTWRRFAAAPVPLADIASLLQLTWGVQRWGAVAGQGAVALKTSPSGGARHSVECYLLSLNVSDLTAGAYHYDAVRHALVDVGSISRDRVGRALGDQFYFAAAAAVFVMTAVFARAMWRYPFSRAYRSVLAEVGHLGQTFCLLATARRLAPFCTMAFRDSEVESMIGVDGSRESALYVVGVGARPRGRTAHPGRIPARFRARA